MTRYQLNKAVSRATGDDHDVIMSRGFSLVDESATINDDDVDALIADWDRIQNEEMLMNSTLRPTAVRTKRSKYLPAMRVGVRRALSKSPR